MEMAPEAVPEGLRDGWPGIVGGVLKVFKTLPKAVEDRKQLEQELQEEESSDDDSDGLNLAGDDEDVWDVESAYMELLANEGARLRQRANEEELDEVEEEDEDEDEEERIKEELGFISPLDSINPYVSFKQALTTFQMRNPHIYRAGTTALDIEQQTLLMEVMRIAEQETNGSLEKPRI